ncbi:hypothetical protein [Streptomyces mirabilis]|uniref:hypothetical protein n=1 Tax=Streptomyces mirabilis TaxID=68239 RepID=UPI0036B8A748
MVEEGEQRLRPARGRLHLAGSGERPVRVARMIDEPIRREPDPLRQLLLQHRPRVGAYGAAITGADRRNSDPFRPADVLDY